MWIALSTSLEVLTGWWFHLGFCATHPYNNQGHLPEGHWYFRSGNFVFSRLSLEDHLSCSLWWFWSIGWWRESWIGTTAARATGILLSWSMTWKSYILWLFNEIFFEHLPIRTERGNKGRPDSRINPGGLWYIIRASMPCSRLLIVISPTQFSQTPSTTNNS